MNFENAGAVNARVIRIRTTTAAPTAMRSRLKRVQKSCHGVRPSTFSVAPSSGTRTSIAGSVCWTWLTRRYPCSRPPKCRAERIRGQHRNDRTTPGYPAAPGISPQERDESGHDLDPAEEAERAFGAGSLAEGDRAVGVDGSSGDQQGDRVSGVSALDARGRVVRGDGDDGAGRVDPREQLPEEPPVDRRDDVALVFEAAVMGGDVGPLDMDVESLEPAERVRGELRACRVRSVGRRSEPCRIEARRVDGFHPERQGDTALHGHLHEAPPAEAEPFPDRLEGGPPIPAVARQDQVGRKLPFRAPFGVDGRRLQDRRRPFDERVRERGGSVSGLAVREGLGRDHARLERLERDAEVALPSVRRIGVRDFGRKRRAVVGTDHERSPVLDRGAELERGAGKHEGPVHFIGEPRALVGREVATYAAIDDLRTVRGCAVHAVREVAVAEVHRDPEHLEHAPAGVLLMRVVAQDPVYPDVGFWRDPGSDRQDGPGPTARGERVEVRRVRGLERRAPGERGDGVVPQPVQAHVQQRGRHRYFTINANSSGSRLAPPTSAPSMSGCAMNSRMLPGLTLPPYWTRISWASPSSYLVASVPRISSTTRPASPGPAVRPVPIAQMGSYATTTDRANDASTPPNARRTCWVTVASVPPASRSSSVSPTHRIGVMPCAKTDRSFLFTRTSSSPKSWRRSECPTIT